MTFRFIDRISASVLDSDPPTVDEADRITIPALRGLLRRAMLRSLLASASYTDRTILVELDEPDGKQRRLGSLES